MAPFGGVVTTSIYCCPGRCSGRPKERNRRWFDSAAAAEAAGFRACHQCRPYRTQPGWWLEGPELVCRALRLVLDGALDSGGTEAELAARVGASSRHLRRLFLDNVGATPSVVARSARAHFARRLLDDTDLPCHEIALLAGFGSVRQFNKVMHATFRGTPTELRAKRRRGDRLTADGGLTVRLPFPPPLPYEDLLSDLAAAAVPGVESVAAARYRRTISVAGDAAVLEVAPGGADFLLLTVHLPHWESLLHIVQRARRVFDLDRGPAPRTSPSADRVAPAGRRRAPGAWDPFEVGVDTLVGLEGAADRDEVLRCIVGRLGRPVEGVAALGLTHLFPRPVDLLHGDLGRAPLTPHGRERLTAFARSVVAGEIPLDGSLGQGELVELLEAQPALAPVARALADRLGYGLGSDRCG